MTKNILTKAALGLVLALSASAPSVLAKSRKPRPSAEHTAAIKKCGDEYKAAQRSARTLKGKERSGAYAKAKADRKQCIADAPK